MTNNGQRRPAYGAAAAVAFFCVAFGVMAYAASSAFLSRGYGFLYPLDDSYIHLAISRTLASTGEWGIAPGYPSSASSSPLWTLLLSAVAVVVPHMTSAQFTWVPLILNGVAAIGLTLFWWRRLSQTPAPTIATCVLILLVPLPAIALIGMEHVLHAWVATVFAWRAAVLLEAGDRPSTRDLAWLAALSAVAVAARYESLALVATIAALSMLYRRWRIAPAVLVPAILVAAGFALLWIGNGGWAVPNSLLLKTTMETRTSGIWTLFENIRGNIVRGNLHLIVFGGALSVLLVAIRRQPSPVRAFALLALTATLAQFALGKLGWLYRYEAWLLALDGLAIVLAADIAFKGRRWPFLAVLLLVSLVGAPRSFNAMTKTVEAADDRAWEHVDSAIALAPFAGQTILANDIGVVAYHGRPTSIDIYGLANNDVLRLKREARFDVPQFRAFAARENAHIALFQLCWPPVSNVLPPEWRLVEVWNGPRNVVFTDRSVHFMADSAAAAQRLKAVLAAQRFRPDVIRFDDTSALVRNYNSASDKRTATEAICVEAPRQADAVRAGNPAP